MVLRWDTVVFPFVKESGMQTATHRKLQVIFDVHQYRLSPAEEQTLHGSLDLLSRQVEHFPIADLHVMIEGNARSNDVSVKFSLMLPGTTLVTNDHDASVHTAFERCLNSLQDSLQAYKDQLGRVPERHKAEKGTLQELHPTVPIDAEALARAADAGDFGAFRTALLPYEEGLRKRVGRWVQRYPAFEAQIGKGVEIADIVEDVFLLALEGYAHRPLDVALGVWLENLIDPAIKALQSHRDEELENINLARTAMTAERP
jgi:ribosome-associated translation inhibitor RaiA